MSEPRSVRLRALRGDDLDALAAGDTADADSWNHFEIRPSNLLQARFAANGGIADEHGMLAVETIETVEATLVGSVGWVEVRHGPTAACKALNLGISILPAYRGRGYGSEAQRLLAEYLFSSRLVERLEAGTDVENLAEQRALEKAGFHREGVLRHAQFRGGRWRDVVLFSRLRGDGDVTPESA
ncbi:MAG: GNAT family N-acetyltransferase [Acidimicrobiales bacterium]